ncbi:hypothetical protein HZH66_007117 [Vespula vulgaris]|uniref:Uncharacterized protein n=1 Tax=Vespula vulgaris TaxID=7454 RepID=A0A834N4A5_VESVU|nr:hypothetical protein HZH66_007117 [Vespula vulgaris]
MEYDRSRRGNACNRITVSRMISIWYSKSPLNGFFRLEYWENESFPLQISRGVERTVVSIGQSRPRDRQWIYHIQQGSLHRGQRRRQVPLIRYTAIETR